MINLGLFRHSDTKSVPAGEVIFQAGEPGAVMYVVSEGQVEILVGTRVVETVGAGSIFGEMALIDGGSRSAKAVAKTDCMLVPVDQRRFEFLVQQTPFFALQVMQLMADRLRRSNAAIST